MWLSASTCTDGLQLTKEQLSSVLPLLGQHLSGEDVVVYTYAAVAIDRILAIRAPGSPTPLCALVICALVLPLTLVRFTYVDVKPFALTLIDVLLRKVESAGTPEKVAENDLVMRCKVLTIALPNQPLTMNPRPGPRHHHCASNSCRRISASTTTPRRGSRYHLEEPQ